MQGLEHGEADQLVPRVGAAPHSWATRCVWARAQIADLVAGKLFLFFFLFHYFYFYLQLIISSKFKYAFKFKLDLHTPIFMHNQKNQHEMDKNHFVHSSLIHLIN